MSRVIIVKMVRLVKCQSFQGSEEEKTCFRQSDKDGKLGLLRDVSPSQGLLQTEEARERAKRLSTIPISRLCLIV